MKRIPVLAERDRPLIFAHRGCSSLAPENTMAAFRRAREVGSPGIELDVHLCATGELVVIHDANLARTTGADKLVEETSLAEIRALDAGSSFGPEFAGERVPLLAEVLNAFVPGAYIDIELKSKKKTNDPLPGALARFLNERAENFSSLHPEAGPLSSWITVSSFNPLALAAFKKLAPGFATSIIWSGDAEVPWYLRNGAGRWVSRCDYLKPSYEKATGFSLGLLSTIGGRPTVPWVVDDADLARSLIARGCAGVITNRPQDIVPALIAT